MSFKDIDKIKFCHIIQTISNHRQLSEFFKTYWDELISKGVNLKYLPVKEKAFEQFVDLPTSADTFIISWLDKQLIFIDPEPILPVIGMLSYIDLNINEILAKPPIDPEIKKYALSALCYLSQDEPPPKLLEYLRSPLNSNPTENGSSLGFAEAFSEDDSPSDLPEAIRYGGYDVFECLLNGQEALDMTGKSESFRDCYYIIRSIMYYKASRYKEAYQYLSKLSPYCPFRLKLQQTIDDAESKLINTQEEYPRNFYDPDDFKVIAYCHSVQTKVAYLTPVALIDRENKLYYVFDRQQREIIFPNNGQLICFSNSKSVWLPKKEEMAIWSTSIKETEQNIKTNATLDEKKPLHQVHFIEFFPDQTEMIRDRMKEIMIMAEGDRFTPIFCLNNQLYVSGRPNQSRAVDDNAFFANMLAWRHLPRLLLNNKQYVLGPLPPEDIYYNCAPVSYTFASLLKNEMERVSLDLTKSQVSFLSNYIDTFADRVEVSSIEYIRKALDNIINSKDEVNNIVQEMLQLPVIKTKIDDYIEINGAKLLAKKTTIVDEINKLQIDHKALLEQIEKRKKEIDSLPAMLSDEINKRFEQARLDGMKELSNIALLKSFIPERQSNDSVDLKFSVKRDVISGKGLDLKEWLDLFGLSQAKVASILASCELSKQAGPIVAVKGLGARLIVEKLAASVGPLNGATIIDMEVEVNRLDCLRQFLTIDDGSQPVLAILDANLSPMDIYGRQLFDYVLGRIAASDPPHSHILASLSDSAKALQIPNQFLSSMVLIDLDNYSKYVAVKDQSLEAVKDSLLHTGEETLLTKLFWPPLAKRLRGYIETLDPIRDAVRIRTLASVFEHQKLFRPEIGSAKKIVTGGEVLAKIAPQSKNGGRFFYQIDSLNDLPTKSEPSEPKFTRDDYPKNDSSRRLVSAAQELAKDFRVDVNDSPSKGSLNNPFSGNRSIGKSPKIETPQTESASKPLPMGTSLDYK